MPKATPITPPFYPVVLVRGFAARAEDIEAATNQVYLGFEAGSTKRRQDADGRVLKWFFESVVVRLMKDLLTYGRPADPPLLSLAW